MTRSRARPRKQPADSILLELDPATHAGLVLLARQHGITPAAAALAMLQWSHGAHDTVAAACAAQRPRPPVERLVVNALRLEDGAALHDGEPGLLYAFRARSGGSVAVYAAEKTGLAGDRGRGYLVVRYPPDAHVRSPSLAFFTTSAQARTVARGTALARSRAEDTAHGLLT